MLMIPNIGGNAFISFGLIKFLFKHETLSYWIQNLELFKISHVSELRTQISTIRRRN